MIKKINSNANNILIFNNIGNTKKIYLVADF